VGEDAIVLEVMIRGRHLGTWRGLDATGQQIEFPLCGIFTFDERNRLAAEKIYYDRATLLGQLGVFHDPESLRGRIATAFTHPITRLAGDRDSGRSRRASQSSRFLSIGNRALLVSDAGLSLGPWPRNHCPAAAKRMLSTAVGR
jgi:hypothetical protein